MGVKLGIDIGSSHTDSGITPYRTSMGYLSIVQILYEVLHFLVFVFSALISCSVLLFGLSSFHMVFTLSLLFGTCCTVSLALGSPHLSVTQLAQRWFYFCGVFGLICSKSLFNCQMCAIS